MKAILHLYAPTAERTFDNVRWKGFQKLHLT